MLNGVGQDNQIFKYLKCGIPIEVASVVYHVLFQIHFEKRNKTKKN